MKDWIKELYIKELNENKTEGRNSPLLTKKKMEYKEYIEVTSVTGYFEDAVAKYYKLGYKDTELYSVTVEDAYRSLWTEIMNKEQLNSFLDEFTNADRG